MVKKEKKKTDKEPVKENEQETKEEIPDSVKEKETRQLIWFFVIIGVLFASFLVPYLWIESSKKFEYAGASWSIEKPGKNLVVFHGRFLAVGKDHYHNIFLRTDPRKNEVPFVGEISKLRRNAIISYSKEVNTKCTGEFPRAMLDFAMFLKGGLKIDVSSATIDEDYSKEKKSLRLANCSTDPKKLVIVVKKGDESKVIKTDESRYCYIIQLKSCDDIAPIEKLTTELIAFFRESDE